MTKKIWDIVPATNFMQEFVAKANYGLIGLSIRRKKVEVKTPEELDFDYDQLLEKWEARREWEAETRMFGR